ncbi:aldo/keto reductase [bacterium]|nr:aldo/keto reductase [bacterium]
MNASSLYRPLGSTGLFCHPMGFGSYRISEGNAVHESALRHYLDIGGNLIDTSANYGDGLSETLIGKVLKDYDRTKIILVTKGGYIQGQNMVLASHRTFPEVVEYTDDLWHCIHPEFLETQIERSLRRMQTDVIDVYLLHNPEYFINHAATLNPITESVLDKFYKRIRNAFQFLESQVKAGRIRYYGISSNNFGAHGKDRARTSAQRVLVQAEDISTDHHFKVIQLPMNLYEAGGAVFPTHNGKTVLHFCKEKNIGVLINRPLNAFFGNKLYRIADYVKPGETKPGEKELEKVLSPLKETEDVFTSTFGGEAFGSDREGIAAYLKFVARDLPSGDYWDGVMNQYIVPPITHWMRQAQEQFGNDTRWSAWQNRFIQVINQSLDGIERFLSASKQSTSDTIRQNLYQSGHPESKESLSRIALSLLTQLDGVSCVLNGMRTPDYVTDAMGVSDMPRVDALAITKNYYEKLNAKG